MSETTAQLGRVARLEADRELSHRYAAAGGRGNPENPYEAAVNAASKQQRACSYCKATGVELEPFNPAGNLACKNVKQCSFNMATAGLTPVELAEGKGCSRCKRDIPAGPAFVDQDDLFVCGDCREHIGTCDDPDCDHG